VKEDIFRTVRSFHDGELEVFRLNFSMLTSIPKVEETTEMKNYRPISLLNYSFKIFSKLLTSRLDVICQRLIAKKQTAFMRRRYILESVVVAHEVVHSVHKTKEPGVVIKLDYEKAYDMVNLDFLMDFVFPETKTGNDNPFNCLY
jgi:hypothetical protein